MTTLKSDRRHDEREEQDRRGFPRPPLWLNLLLLVLAVAGLAFARYHRGAVEKRFARVMTEERRTPADLNKIKQEVAGLNLSREELARELQGRMKLAASLRSENFYLSADTQQKKLRFYYGDTVLRETDMAIGASTTIISPQGKSWTFVPLKGAFPVQGKAVGFVWKIPEWAYAVNKQQVPPERPMVPGGLGKYVVFLPNNYVIHSPPAAESPLKAPKPGSIMVPEDFLQAIWARIQSNKTQVYIF